MSESHLTPPESGYPDRPGFTLFEIMFLGGCGAVLMVALTLVTWASKQILDLV
jgi:hypothetical protein